MPLTPGTRLGPYEIVEPIGAGGMGEVWKAFDSRLGRSVAIKIAKSEFTERFEREARSVAALNHPHICTLHDVGPNYLVMELVEGTPLKGPVPVETAVSYGKQILDALEAAHRKGIVHRDLKPDNILVTRQGVKLLDFGLARQTAPLSEMDATVTRALTNKGEIVGTLQYMAPEQLQGREADARSDLFAFGCVLYELISGKPAFSGENAASVIAAVMEREPARIDVAAPLDRIIRTCLAKNPEERFQNALDLKRAIIWALDGAATPAVSKASTKGRWWLAAVPTTAVLVVGLALMMRPAAAPDVVRFPLVLGRFSSSYGFQAPVLSPDGRQLAYIRDTIEGRRQLFVRRLDASEPQAIAGTSGVTSSAWGPDSQRLAFVADGKFMTVDLRTRATREIGETGGFSLVHMGWGADGGILYSAGAAGPLMRIPELGGTPSPATALDEAQGEMAHDFPSFCPDGRHFVFHSIRKDGQVGLRLGVTGPPAKGVVLEANFPAACTTAPGAFGEENYLLEVGIESIVARRLNLSSGSLSPSTTVIASGPNFQSSRLLKGNRISASRNGTVVYSLAAAAVGKLAWYDRMGRVLEELPVAAAGLSPALSKDEQRIAVFRPTGSGSDIWATDLARKTAQKLVLPTRNSSLPVWSPDGSHIAFSGEGGIYEGAASGGDARLVSPLRGWPQQYTADGRHVLFVNIAKSDLELLPLSGEATPTVVAPPGPTYFPATLAPGEGFVAYTSTESGRPEVYVRAMPPATGKWIISNDGGGMAAWSGDGKELFYLGADLRLMSVEVSLTPKFQAGTPKPLFPTKMSGVLSGRNNFVVSRDGKRFLILTPPDDLEVEPVTVVVNWPTLLKKDSASN